ncbi:MAG: PDZ domain-containing protein, partial [Planctomycetota bacterium]
PFLKASGLLVRADPSGRGPSDHAPFYGAGIPVLFFFTGVHDSYHKPGDMGYSVDPRGIPALLGMVEKIALWRAKDPERLVFATPDGPRRQPREEQIVVPATPTPAVPAAAPAPGDRGYAPVRLGIQPGPTEDGESGLLVLAVTAGTSAADAGIAQGDVLLSWNGAALEDSGMLAQKLREHKPGDVVKMRILRDGKELEIDVTLKASNAAQRRPQND